jgi:hypothetical protein
MDRFVWFGIAAVAFVTIFLVWAMRGGRYPAGEKPKTVATLRQKLTRVLRQSIQRPRSRA